MFLQGEEPRLCTSTGRLLQREMSVFWNFPQGRKEALSSRGSDLPRALVVFNPPGTVAVRLVTAPS